ncbi:E3 ubiquitin-protein ligase LRSAM1 [Galendromus occidentalis]|uniref:E3 ubiquitin-protein ligase LRSAM1 n=1 Tax=Galendromus occidentalis TaxID=34638 RepID=A0AAJ7L2I5_9ACAR|nr:E3 ubiquitin-protein ligase LRSAM1 [Galendromus occidentalis]XP_018493733.1 E3 ubiquitin-protein ligase LRSAM1 [Galendromus occidentalis]
MFPFKSNKANSAAMSASSTKDQAFLQRRLYLAENTPEPIFDLSECGLEQLPPGVLAKCRVFRKTSLLLQHNSLKSLPDLRDLTLLTVLNVSSNLLKTLPDSIGCLVKLEILDLHSNQLTKLPSTMSKLKSLRVLDISNNELSRLPPGVRSLGCEIRAEGCPLLEPLDYKEKNRDSPPASPEHPGATAEAEPDLGNVWERRERMLKELRQEMLDVEERLYELTVNEYEKRDKRQNDNMMNIAQERVELAANLNELILKKEIELSEFRSAGVSTHFEDSGIADRDCVVCLGDGLQLIVLLPCGHVCVCRYCAEKLTVCPLCRQELRTEIAN